jgi:DNA-directed RNA polymerase subunit M/transcription elongation factor TFIIS
MVSILTKRVTCRICEKLLEYEIINKEEPKIDFKEIKYIDKDEIEKIFYICPECLYVFKSIIDEYEK